MYYPGKAGHSLSTEGERERKAWRWSLEKQNDTCLSKEGTQRLPEKKQKLLLTEQNT